MAAEVSATIAASMHGARQLDAAKPAPETACSAVTRVEACKSSSVLTKRCNSLPSLLQITLDVHARSNTATMCYYPFFAIKKSVVALVAYSSPITLSLQVLPDQNLDSTLLCGLHLLMTSDRDAFNGIVATLTGR